MRRTAQKQSAAIATALAIIALIAAGLICMAAAVAMAHHRGDNYMCHLTESLRVACLAH